MQQNHFVVARAIIWITTEQNYRWMYIHEQHNVLPKGGKSVTRTTTPLYRPLSNPLGRCEWWTWIIIMNLEYGAKPDKQSFSGNVELNWPKLFHTFSYILTSFFLHKCIHSIIPRHYMYKREKLMLPGGDLRAILGWFRDWRNNGGEWCVKPTFKSALNVNNMLHQYA